MRPDHARRLLVAERDRLRAARAAVLRDCAGGETQRAAAGELSDLDEHIADVASDTFEREVELGFLATLDAELVEVERALLRIAHGRYGRCERCGGAIADERLQAVPATALCLRHQEAAELYDASTRGGGSERVAAREAGANLDLLPSEEPEPRPVAAEDAAMHIYVPPG